MIPVIFVFNIFINSFIYLNLRKESRMKAKSTTKNVENVGLKMANPVPE